MQENIIRGIGKVNRAGTPQRDSVTTTNATPAIIKTVEVDSNTGGILEVTVVGKNDGGTGSVTAKQIVRYDKTTTLTLGTPANILALQTDVTGATFSITSVSDNIQISVTGAASTVVNWTVETKLINQVATNTP